MDFFVFYTKQCLNIASGIKQHEIIHAFAQPDITNRQFEPVRNADDNPAFSRIIKFRQNNTGEGQRFVKRLCLQKTVLPHDGVKYK